jgi:Tfp pilus assembly protein PilF
MGARRFLLVAAVAFAVYAPSLGGGFLYDDYEVVVTNPFIRDLGDLRSVLLYEPSRPLLNLTWALNYALGGLEPWPYHLVNILIHCGNAALIASLFHFLLVRRRPESAAPVAILGACLFAASPMAAETVAYVASRSTALVTFFSLASLRLAVNVLATPTRRLRLAASLALFLLALATKEEAAAVPPLLLLIDYLFVAEGHLTRLKSRLSLHVPFWSFIALGLVGRRFVTGSWLPAPAIDRGSYLLTQWAAFPLYFLRALLPFDPAFYRYHAAATWPPDAATVTWAVLAAAMVLVAWRKRRDSPLWSFSVFALAAGLLPSSSVVPLQEMVVDHRAYLGSMGVLLVLAATVWRWGGARLGVLLVLVFATRAIHYEWILADPVRAWEDATRRAPASADAVCALGEAYAARGDARAEAMFLRATTLDPTHYRYWANLGVYYSEAGRHDDAARALRRAATEAPQNAAVRDYLGVVLEAAGRVDEAAAEFEAALRAEPDFVQAYINLAALKLKRRTGSDVAEALTLLERARHLPTDPQQAERIMSLHKQL